MPVYQAALYKIGQATFHDLVIVAKNRLQSRLLLATCDGKSIAPMLGPQVLTFAGHSKLNERKMKRRLFLTIFVCLVAVTHGSVGHAQEKLEKILVGVAGLSGALAHAFIPKDSGLYEKYGLDVDLVFFQGGTQAFKQLSPAGYNSPSPPDLRSSMHRLADRT